MSSFWMPGAIRKPLDRNFTRSTRRHTNAVVLHVAVSESASLHGWFNNPRARASSHFYVRRDGTIEQYIPINWMSWAGVQSDNRAISVETQGMGHGAWTQAQIRAMQQIIKYCQTVYPGIPSRTMRSSKSSEAGIGWHALGVPTTYAQKLRRVSQTGGELWSGAVGKVCPGPDRIKQIPALVAGIASAGSSASVPGSAGQANANAKTSGRSVTAKVGVIQVQQQLRDAGYYKGRVDGSDGPMTAQAVLAYQKGQRYFPGLLRDGKWGDLTQAHFDWVKRLQTALNGWKTSSRIGKTKIDGDYGQFADRLVRQTINDNFRGAYTKAVKAEYGWNARPVNDGQPGRAFCRMLNIPHHPTA